MTKFGAIALAGGLLLGSATTASALQQRSPANDARIETTRQETEAKRALRQQIRAKQREYRELRRADDPRAAQVQQEVRALKAEWTRLYGNDDAERRVGRADDVRGRNADRKPPHRGWNGEGHGKAKGHGKHKH